MTSGRRRAYLAAGISIVFAFAGTATLAVPAVDLSTCLALDPGVRGVAIVGSALTVIAAVLRWRLSRSSFIGEMRGTIRAVLVVGVLLALWPLLALVSLAGYGLERSGVRSCALSDPAELAIGFAALLPVAALAVAGAVGGLRRPWRDAGLAIVLGTCVAGLVAALAAWR